MIFAFCGKRLDVHTEGMHGVFKAEGGLKFQTARRYHNIMILQYELGFQVYSSLSGTSQHIDKINRLYVMRDSERLCHTIVEGCLNNTDILLCDGIIQSYNMQLRGL